MLGVAGDTAVPEKRRPFRVTQVEKRLGIAGNELAQFLQPYPLFAQADAARADGQGQVVAGRGEGVMAGGAGCVAVTA